MAKNIEIVKPITLEIGEKTYTLEFNRNSVMSAERAGLNLADFEKMPLNTTLLLFYCSFKMHHPEMTRQQTDEIYFDILNGLTAEEIKRLGELYNAPAKYLVHEDGAERKNAKISL